MTRHARSAMLDQIHTSFSPPYSSAATLCSPAENIVHQNVVGAKKEYVQQLQNVQGKVNIKMYNEEASTDLPDHADSE
jgi:hypothetical protein